MNRKFKPEFRHTGTRHQCDFCYRWFDRFDKKAKPVVSYCERLGVSECKCQHCRNLAGEGEAVKIDLDIYIQAPTYYVMPDNLDHYESYRVEWAI